MAFGTGVREGLDVSDLRESDERLVHAIRSALYNSELTSPFFTSLDSRLVEPHHTPNMGVAIMSVEQPSFTFQKWIPPALTAFMLTFSQSPDQPAELTTAMLTYRNAQQCTPACLLFGEMSI